MYFSTKVFLVGKQLQGWHRLFQLFFYQPLSDNLYFLAQKIAMNNNIYFADWWNPDCWYNIQLCWLSLESSRNVWLSN